MIVSVHTILITLSLKSIPEKQNIVIYNNTLETGAQSTLSDVVKNTQSSV